MCASAWKSVLIVGFVALAVAAEESTCKATASRQDAGAAAGPLPEVIRQQAPSLLQRSHRSSRKSPRRPASLREPSPLCNDAVVREACLDFEADADGSTPRGGVSKGMVMGELAANASMVDALWEALGLGTSASVPCMGLCQAAVEYIGKVAQLPPSNDKACYRTAGGSVACDLDVSLDALQRIKFRGSLPERHSDDKHSDDKAEDKAAGLLATAASSGLRRANGTASGRVSGSSYRSRVSSGPVIYTVHTLVERVANTFHIYPAPGLVGPKGTALRQERSESAQCLDAASRASQKAKVWVSSVIAKVQRRETRPHMQRWFGAAAVGTRREVLRVLNSIDATMAGVEYVLLPNRPDGCDADSYAFVMHDGDTGCHKAALRTGNCQTNAAGEKVIYLCNLFCRSSEKVQVQTLAHEGSHHLPANTDDVPPEPYGREACLRMAQSRPAKALQNADNYCFYVTDVVLGLGGSPAPGPPAVPRCPSAASGYCDPAHCTCGGQEVRANEGGCFYCAPKCPSDESGLCGDWSCRCGRGERRVAEWQGCYYCAAGGR
mmetsp:Transcript_48350/g.144364  ORF Transcript_48350/g.144364 Transcript_48350/m.144364 type:complete len:550 (-) Transcript_48350:9-1658(-)